MSRSKATKRRRVWVLSDKDGHNAFSFDPPTAKARAYWTRAGRTCTLCVERLPGDVVLSREEVAEMKAIIMALVSRSDFPAHYDRALALLRGRR